MLVLFIALCLFAMCNPELASRAHPHASTAAYIPSFLTLILGLVIGCYGTIVGIGGGPLVVPILLVFYDWPAEDVVASSLFVVFLNALSGSAGYAAQGRIDFRGGITFSLAALPGAVLSGFVHHLVDVRSFDRIFGCFLLLLAGYTLLRIVRTGPRGAARARPAWGARRVVIVDRSGKRHVFHSDDNLGISVNFFLGFLVGFLGIGGGVFQVPTLIFFLGFPTHIATATSHLITMLTSGFALGANALLGNIRFAEIAWLALGVVVGAQAGARIARNLRSNSILYLFVGILALLAARLLAS